jgi:type IV pilus assembly protein PilY1
MSTCFKPVILIISDTFTDYDGDSVSDDLDKPIMYNTFAGGLSSADLPAKFNLNNYLWAITKVEGINTSGRVRYYYSKNETDNCEPKSLYGGLGDVHGLCPNSQNTMGTYSAAAAAYYAHIHNFNTSKLNAKIGVDVYSVAMSSAFPELVFQLGSGKWISHSITIFPVNASEAVASSPPMPFLNYFIIEWDVDRTGTIFHAKIKVNFSDKDQGDDWEGDGQVTYTIDLLTDSNTPFSKRELKPAKIDSGDSFYNLTLYRFENPEKANSVNDFIYIRPDEVRALLIESSWSVTGTAVGMGMGYTISGSQRDGTYYDLTMNNPPRSPNLTPKDCPFVKAKSYGTYGCGKQVPNIKSQSRAFRFNSYFGDVTNLPNILYLAAKYGGFNDKNRNNIPDEGEWEGSEGEPKNYFRAKNILALSDQLDKAFKAISQVEGAESSTAANLEKLVGGGLSVQSVYYPIYLNPKNPTQQVNWVGSVFGLFMDRYGNLREDSNKDGVLTLANGEQGEDGDYVVTFNNIKTRAKKPPNCYEFGSFVSRCYDPFGNNQLKLFEDRRRHPDNIHQINAVFDTGKWLAYLDDTKLLAGSRDYKTPATIGQSQRRIYFGNPNPIEPSKSTLELFDLTGPTERLIGDLLLPDNYKEYLPGFATRNETVRALIAWIIGVDNPSFRRRKVGDPWGDNKTQITWRLGDILNSKPIIVSRPSGNFDYLYGDQTYTIFRDKYRGRRTVAYFGANDGMLHAINLGFGSSIKDNRISYLKQGIRGNQVPHELGAELWAYIPTSLLPHLQWLPSPFYEHTYYVDLKPLVSDVKINGQWRTVLLGGLRYGGRPIENPAMTPGQEFYYSEVFCLDITAPEEEPKLLWRYSDLKAGLTVGLPVFLSHEGKFYAIIPSGPIMDVPKLEPGKSPKVTFGDQSPYDGFSNQRARLIVLDAATGEEVAVGKRDPEYLTAQENNSFFNNPFLPVAEVRQTPWTNHVLYYGLTVSRNIGQGIDSGAIYRLQTVDQKGKPLPVELWKLARLFNTERPVTGAVNSAYDAQGNLWVVFGTGRLWNPDDLSPCVATDTKACRENHEQYFFGIKEELSQGHLTFSDRSQQADLVFDVSGAKVLRNGTVTDIKTQTTYQAGSGSSLMYKGLKRYLATNAVIGYKRKLELGGSLTPNAIHNFEVLVNQPKIVGLGRGKSSVAFTSFEPNLTACEDIGTGYLYVLDTFTGLPDPTSELGLYEDPSTPATPHDELKAGATTGIGMPSEAFVTPTATGYVISASSSDASTVSTTLKTRPEERSNVTGWREVLDVGYGLTSKEMILNLK